MRHTFTEATRAADGTRDAYEKAAARREIAVAQAAAGMSDQSRQTFSNALTVARAIKGGQGAVAQIAVSEAEAGFVSEALKTARGIDAVREKASALYKIAACAEAKKQIRLGDDSAKPPLWPATDTPANASASLGQQPKLRATLGEKDNIKPVISVAFSPDSNVLAYATGGRIRLWDIATNTNVATFGTNIEIHGMLQSRVTSVAFSPDGKSLVSGTEDGAIKVWNVISGKNTATLTKRPCFVVSATFSPDGKSIASGSDGMVKLWDLASGKNTATLKAQSDEWAVGWITAVVFSPDGKTLASGGVEKSIKLWDATSGKSMATLKGHAAEVTCLAFSPDGKTLASGSWDATIRLWDVASRKNTATINGYDKAVHCVAFSPNGKTLASGSEDTTIKLWDVATRKNVAHSERSRQGCYCLGIQPGRPAIGVGKLGHDGEALGHAGPAVRGVRSTLLGRANIPFPRTPCRCPPG